VYNLNEKVLFWVVDGLIMDETLKATLDEAGMDLVKNWLKKYALEL
jgi:hypothetical protein